MLKQPIKISDKKLKKIISESIDKVTKESEIKYHVRQVENAFGGIESCVRSNVGYDLENEFNNLYNAWANLLHEYEQITGENI